MNLLLFTRKSTHLILFIILKLIIDLALSKEPKVEVNILCTLDSGLREINSLPELCTIIASYNSDSETSYKDIAQLRGGRPFYSIINKYSYDELRYKLDPKYIGGFVSELSTHISQENVTAVIIDNLDKTDGLKFNTENATDYEQVRNAHVKTFQKELCDLYKQLKQHNSKVLFGVAIDKIKYSFIGYDVHIIDQCVDLYLLKTYSYSSCIHENKQHKMATTSPLDQMVTSIKTMNETGFSLKKSIYIIRVIVNSSRGGKAKASDDESYTSLCNSNPGEKRKYCRDELVNYFKKGQIVKNLHMYGALMQSVDRDDYNGSCKCGEYPVLKAIFDGVRGLPELPPDLATCRTFALLPRDRK